MGSSAEARREELEDPFRLRESGKGVSPQILEVGTLGKELAGRRGQEDLPTVAGRADRGRPIDVQTEVGAALGHRLAGVKTYAKPNSDTRRPGVGAEARLNGDRGREPIARALEGGEELIGTAVDLVSSRVSDGLSEQTPLLVEGSPIILPELLNELGRSLDIGEHQSDSPGRRLDHVDLQPQGTPLSDSVPISARPNEREVKATRERCE